MRANSEDKWLIRRQGDEVEEGRILSTQCYQTVEVGFWDVGEELFSTNLWYCQEPNAPSRQTEGKSVKAPCHSDMF